MKNYFLKIALTIIGIAALLLPFFTSADDSGQLQSQIQQKQIEIKQLEQKIAAYQQQIKQQKSQESTLAKQISNMQTQIAQLEEQIKLTQTKISAASLEINQITADINLKNNEIQKQNENLGEIIRTIYLYDQQTSIELVLANDNFSDFLNQAEFMNDLQKGIKEKLDSIKHLKNQLENDKGEVEAQKGQLEDLSGQLSGQNLVLSNQKSDKQTLLTQTKNQEKKYQQMLSDLQKKREQIQKDIYALEDKLRLQIDFSKIPAFASGVLAWPLTGRITQGFGPTSQTGFINEAYQFHNGIDIDADIGDPVRAAADGTITAIGDNGKYAYGKWVTIDHKNGLITLYGHFSGYAVSVGQKVKKGQIIGYAGSTGFSTGAHLHFTVYAASTFSTQQKWYGLLPLGGAINPMNYL